MGILGRSFACPEGQFLRGGFCDVTADEAKSLADTVTPSSTPSVILGNLNAASVPAGEALALWAGTLPTTPTPDTSYQIWKAT